MISKPEIAKQVSDSMLDLFNRLEGSLAAVKENCPPEESAAYVKATTRIADGIVMDVLEPLYNEHPALKPHNWDD